MVHPSYHGDAQEAKGNVDDAIDLLDNLDEVELTQSQKDEAIADFRQEIRVLRNLDILTLCYYLRTRQQRIMKS